jgi:hypothetical protein
MKPIHDQAVFAAHEAARCVFFDFESPINSDAAEELLRFIIDTPLAPPEATWIKAGALGIHGGGHFHEASADLRLAYTVFVGVLRFVNDAVAASIVAQEEADALARLAATAPRIVNVADMTDAQLEDTPFERQPNPLDPTPGLRVEPAPDPVAHSKPRGKRAAAAQPEA